MEGSLMISLKDHTVTTHDGFVYPLSKKFFNLYVLLALERIKPEPNLLGFVDVGYIADLPFWEKNNHLSIGKQISRHINEMEKTGRNVIGYIQKVKGPYRIKLKPENILLDASMDDLKNFLDFTPLSLVTRQTEDTEETFYDYVHNMWQGEAFFHDGCLDEALDSFRQASEEKINAENRIMALHRMGRILERLGEYKEADNTYVQAYEIINSKCKSNYLLLADNCNFHGWLYYRQGSLEKAEQKYHKALDLLRGKYHYHALGHTFNGLGKIFEAREKFEEALSFYQRTLSCWVWAGYMYGIQACYHNIGNLYNLWADKDFKLRGGKLTGYSREKYKKAIVWAKECNRLCDRIGTGFETSMALILLAYCHARLEKHEEAVDYALNAKKIADISGNIRDLAGAAKRLGRLYWVKKDFKTARQYLNESIGYYLKLNDYEEVEDLKNEYDL